MRKGSRTVIKFNGSMYVLIPFYVAEPYGINQGSPVELDTSKKNELVIRVRRDEK
jgi:antitoxin component of MazEF toxin-antitoxin module